jgi:exonuclease VII large subunit
MPSDKMLMYMSLSLTIIGLTALSIIAYTSEPPYMPVSSISDALVGRVVLVRGVVSNISVSNNLFFTLSDSSGSIHVVSFSKIYNISESSPAEVIGKVSLYKEKYEIVAEKIKAI